MKLLKRLCLALGAAALACSMPAVAQEVTKIKFTLDLKDEISESNETNNSVEIDY